jgi:hypothetical protein
VKPFAVSRDVPIMKVTFGQAPVGPETAPLIERGGARDAEIACACFSHLSIQRGFAPSIAAKAFVRSVWTKAVATSFFSAALDDYQKRVSALLRIFATLTSTYDDLDFVIAGDGPHSARLREPRRCRIP